MGMRRLVEEGDLRGLAHELGADWRTLDIPVGTKARAVSYTSNPRDWYGPSRTGRLVSSRGVLFVTNHEFASGRFRIVRLRWSHNHDRAAIFTGAIEYDGTTCVSGEKCPIGPHRANCENWAEYGEGDDLTCGTCIPWRDHECDSCYYNMPTCRTHETTHEPIYLY